MEVRNKVNGLTPYSQETSQHVNNATTALLKQLCERATDVKEAIQSGDSRLADKLWKRADFPSQVRAIRNFIGQSAFLNRQQDRQERQPEHQSEGRQSEGQGGSVSHRLTPSNLPDDPVQLNEIVTMASRKLARSASASS